ncbi:MAG: hypothetical protein ABEJ70_06515 [Halobacteriaceae archaeon]
MLETLLEVGPVLRYTVGGAALAGVGSVAEVTGLEHALAGETSALTLWLLVFGAIALYGGLLAGRTAFRSARA